MGKFCQIFKMSNIWSNGQVLSNFQDVKYLVQHESIISISESVNFFQIVFSS